MVRDGGTLRLHGIEKGVTWTRLGATAAATAGPATLTLAQQIVPWLAGDEVVAASTDFDQEQAERVVVQTGASNYALDLQGGLTYSHYGQVQDFDPAPPLGGTNWQVDERGEVGLLSHNVKVSGVESPANSGNFGHVFFHRSASSLVAPRIDLRWTEFYDLGIAGVVGRYPLHFHHLLDPGAANRLVVKNCSVHNGAFNGIVVHATKQAKIESNVVYDVRGYGIYLEQDVLADPDHQTTGNKILTNLVLRNENPASEPGALPNQPDPANYAIRNLRNEVKGNVAAGSKRSGFYLNLDRDSAPTAYDGVTFTNNVAHSCGTIGIFQNEEIIPSAELTLSGLRAWKCREHGLWFRCLGDLSVSDFRAADCRSGFYPASRGLRGAGEGHTIVQQSLFVGETANLGNLAANPPAWEAYAQRTLPQRFPYEFAPQHPLEWDPLNGVEMYDGYVEVQDCRFAAFADRNLGTTWPRTGTALTQVAKISAWANDPRNRVRRLEWKDVGRRISFRPPEAGQNQIAFTLVVDEDGSLGYGANVALMPNVPFLVAHRSNATFSSGANNGLNGYFVPLSPTSSGAKYGQVTVELNTNGLLPGTLNRTSWSRILNPGGSEVAGASWIAESIPTDAPAGGHGEFAFPVTVEVGEKAAQLYYRMGYPDGPTTLPDDLSIYYRFAPADGEIVYLEIPYDRPGTGKPSSVDYRDIFESTQPGVEKTSLSDLLAANEHLAWFHSAQSLYLKMTSQTEDQQSPFPFGTELEVRVQ